MEEEQLKDGNITVGGPITPEKLDPGKLTPGNITPGGNHTTTIPPPGASNSPNVGGGGGWFPTSMGSPPEPAIAGGTPVQWSVYQGGNDHYYQAFRAQDGITWDDAKKYATKLGGYLATIESYEENEFVFKQINAPQFWVTTKDKAGSHNDGPWLGASKSAKDGWAWANKNAKLGYANWSIGFPDNLTANQDSLHFYSNDPNSRSANWGASINSALLPGFVVEYNNAPDTSKQRIGGARGTSGG